jgi:carbamoyl-phosphate synthase large subunit
MASAANRSDPVLVWGIAGASLGTEIAKALAAAGYRNIIGCDISTTAFGHFSNLFRSTHPINRESIRESLTQILTEVRPTFILAGGDQVSRIIANYHELLSEHGCRICGNAQNVVELASDKYRVMVQLKEAGFHGPETRLLETDTNFDSFPLPAVLKPRFDSGGSRGVFVVSSREELKSRIVSILQADVEYILQEYVAADEGEYTIGVLSQTDGFVAGSILLQRTFQNMLSVHEQTDRFLISSGASQGTFKHVTTLQSQAEAMAAALGSTGPLNIQARVRQGNLMLFEINPRFSASTYLRTLSGVNELDLYIQHLESGRQIEYPAWKDGLALRTFAEVFVDATEISGRHAH